MYLARFVTKSDIKKSVRTLLSKTIGKVGAKNFTLYGKDEKNCFEKTKTWDAITGE